VGEPKKPHMRHAAKQHKKPDIFVDYGALFRSLPGPYTVMLPDDPKFTFVDVSQAYADMTGVPVTSIVHRPLFEVFPDVSEAYKRTGVNQLREALRTVIRTKKPLALEAFRYDIADPQGDFTEKHWRPTYYPLLDAHGKVVFVLSVSEDVTDELHRVREMHELQEQLEDALAIGKVGSFLWDIESNHVKVNKTLAKLLGFDAAAAASGLAIKVFLASIHEEDRERVLSEIEAALAGGSNFESEYRTVAANGNLNWVLARGRLKPGRHGRVAKFAGVIVDITERHEFEAQIEDARVRDALNRKEAELLHKRNKELETLSRSKDEFVALASHQLRTPATAVKQYLGMVLQGYVGDITETQTEMLDRAFESNERQIQIINQILNAARVDTGRLVMVPAPLDLRSLVRGIVDEMRGTLETKGHTFKAHLEGKPLEVLADVSYLRMAVENIINNASVYTPPPGNITVSVSRQGKQAKIVVSDDGVGIKKADINKLFAKFSRIHNPLSVQAGGSGIGLYLAAEIVRLHNGSITVDSRIRKGTTFTISLPLRESKTAP
jgi:two-component system sensor histidine kinase VicK